MTNFIHGIIVEYLMFCIIILIQQWEEDPDDKTGWSTWGWECENGNLFDDVGYELEEVLEKDNYGHITKARFKYIG